MHVRRAEHAHAGVAAPALLHEFQQAADQRRPLHRCVQMRVAAPDTCKESLAENLRLVQALGRKTALFQLCKYY